MLESTMEKISGICQVAFLNRKALQCIPVFSSRETSLLLD